MEAAGQATDQVIKVTMDGVEYLLRLSGRAATHSAAMLMALGKMALESHESRGAQRLSTMLKSGKELTVFSVSETRLKEFGQEAKRYGITFCALKDKEVQDGVVDLLVRSEDAPKINRIMERYGMDALAEDAQPVQETAERPTTGRRQERRPRSNIEPGLPSWNGSVQTATDERPSVRGRMEALRAQRQAAAPEMPRPYRGRTHKTPER